ncbi:T6SS immunity protein Tli4 family protein [uncultured Haemophilus sp.]|uniref:T6SS immunity protein Tli4 family protein n=1 Tax=uncultured Haemophilus sp. TaxID=237779 RepID=UPI00266F3737|nr:T6SS immunity protein Tli4 family protein [uncultured Haemophilus sp.]
MPKMKISRLMFYSTILTSVMLSSCSQHAQTHSTVENTASNHAQNAAMYWTEQPFCSGRYQINLPSNRISGTGWLKYNGWQIRVRPDYWNLEVESVLEVKEKGYNGSDIFIENRTIFPNKAIAMVTQAPGSWEHSVSKHLKGMLYYVDFYFKLGKNDDYSIRAFVRIMPVNGKTPPNLKQLEKSKVDEAIGQIRNDFFDKLRDRKDTEMPQQQGVCLTEGFIADKGTEPFFGSAGIKIKDYKVVYAELTTGGSLEEDDKPLLERDLFTKDSALDKLFSWAKYSTIRKGNRNINGMTGSEKLVKWQGNRYLFIWEKDDGSVRFKMTFGANEKNTKGSPLSEKEALTAWDAILPTLKKRL